MAPKKSSALHKKIMKKITFITFTAISFVMFSCKKKEVQPVATEVPIHAYTSTITLAYNNSQTNPACFIDLDNGSVYTVSEALQHQLEIDLVYVLRNANANDPMLISIGAFDGVSGYPISYWDKTTLGIDLFSSFNQTALGDGNSSNTASGFDAITTVSGFTTWLGSNTPISDFMNVDPSNIGDIKIFRTQQNKKGAIKIVDCQNGASGFATISIKIEP